MAQVCSLMVLMMAELVINANAGSQNSEYIFHRIETLYIYILINGTGSPNSYFVTCLTSSLNFGIYYLIVN